MKKSDIKGKSELLIRCYIGPMTWIRVRVSSETRACLINIYLLHVILSSTVKVDINENFIASFLELQFSHRLRALVHDALTIHYIAIHKTIIYVS